MWQSPAERKGGARSWSTDGGITVKRRGNPREATVEGHGVIDALPTGKHFNLLVYDDVINEHSVTNPDQVKKATERTELSFSLGVAGGTRKWFIGTRYHFGDTYAHIIENEIAIPRIHRATADGTLNGKPVFLSEPAWRRSSASSQARSPPSSFRTHWRARRTMFLTRWLIPYWTRPTLMNVYILVDPSKGRNRTSDRTAMAVIGIDSNENKYLLDGYCHRMPLSERWQRLRDLHLKWRKMPGVQLLNVGCGGQYWRPVEPIMRRDEDGNPYDLTRVFFEEFALVPFSPRDDLLDAMSRIEDMDPRPPVPFESWEPEDYPDA